MKSPKKRVVEVRPEALHYKDADNPLSILVVDSDQAFQESVANLLLACGVEKFEMASSIDAAREKISKPFFDIILVDLFMPNLNGLRFAQKLQKRMPETKIILLIEEQQLPVLNSAGPKKLNFPTLLKSFVRRDLPELLEEESHHKFGKASEFLLFSQMFADVLTIFPLATNVVNHT
jgi:CheY-like chemotaxis protein